MLFVLNRPRLGSDRVGTERRPWISTEQKTVVVFKDELVQMCRMSNIDGARCHPHLSAIFPTGEGATEPPPRSATESLHSSLVCVTKRCTSGEISLGRRRRVKKRKSGSNCANRVRHKCRPITPFQKSRPHKGSKVRDECGSKKKLGRKEGMNMGQSNSKACLFIQTGRRKSNFTVLL